MRTKIRPKVVDRTVEEPLAHDPSSSHGKQKLMSFSKIAKHFGVTKTAIEQSHKRALEKIRRGLLSTL